MPYGKNKKENYRLLETIYEIYTNQRFYIYNFEVF